LTLNELGWSPFFSEHLQAGLVPARVTEEQRSLWLVETGDNLELWATLPGKYRGDLPAVGDWVGLRGKVIEQMLPRRTRFSRHAAGERTKEQVIAANVDTVFVMTSLNRELNPARVERYLTSMWESGATPVVLLSKSDLVADAGEAVAAVQAIAPGVTVLAISSRTGVPLDALGPFLQPGKTVAFVGSSGVGKSTLINRLIGRDVQDTGAVREGDDKGRHTTTSRKIVLLPGGGLLLDTPGMRELQLWDAGNEGIIQAFPEIEALAAECRFRDCRHQNEPGCAVRAAVEAERLDPRRIESFQKLDKELQFAAIKQDAALRSARNKKWKTLHKAQREAYKHNPKS
jgi:ribosome biogenesis GTPase